MASHLRYRTFPERFPVVKAIGIAIMVVSAAMMVVFAASCCSVDVAQMRATARGLFSVGDPRYDAWRSEMEGTGAPDGGEVLDDRVIGWISVEGTTIDEPVVQARWDDPDFYLAHAADGSTDNRGAIYVDAACNGLDGPVTLMLGHHLRNGGMFSDFARYIDEAYARSHASVTIESHSGVHEATVIGVDVIDATSTPVPMPEAAEPDVADYAQSILAGCDLAIVEEVPRTSANLYCFCTCAGTSRDERVLVYAVESR